MTAQRIIFDDAESVPRATIVEFAAGPMSESYAIKARREIILCAGTVGSPHLLMLSGIGPAEDLQALGIPVLKDLPHVGRNLSDVCFMTGLSLICVPYLRSSI